MQSLKIITDPEVKTVYNRYPDHIKKHIKYLRDLIIETAKELEDIEEIEETLKWQEPSFVTKHGSTIRIDWKQKTPGQYAIYFKCTSKLVPAFRNVFKKTFTFEGNRAIVFKLEDVCPETELKKCISAALRYHKLKNFPNLGL